MPFLVSWLRRATAAIFCDFAGDGFVLPGVGGIYEGTVLPAFFQFSQLRQKRVAHATAEAIKTTAAPLAGGQIILEAGGLSAVALSTRLRVCAAMFFQQPALRVKAV